MTDNTNLTEQELETLRYPIGRYTKPETLKEGMLKEWLAVLSALPSWMDVCIENLDEYQLQTAYRPGGWTVQQVIHHLADSHMNAYIRIKLTLTEDNPQVKPYDEQAWALLPDVAAVPVNISVTMLHALHRRMVALMETLTDEQWQRTYYHPQYKHNVCLWELAALYAWHSRHHMEHVRQLRLRNGW